MRLSWAKLLKRVFEIDMAHCPNCGGQLKIIAAILEQPGCVWAFQGRGLRPRRPGKPDGKRYERHPLGLRSVFNGLVPRPTTTRVRVRELGGGCSGRKKGV